MWVWGCAGVYFVIQYGLACEVRKIWVWILIAPLYELWGLGSELIFGLNFLTCTTWITTGCLLLELCEELNVPETQELSSASGAEVAGGGRLPDLPLASSTFNTSLCGRLQSARWECSHHREGRVVPIRALSPSSTVTALQCPSEHTRQFRTERNGLRRSFVFCRKYSLSKNSVCFPSFGQWVVRIPACGLVSLWLESSAYYDLLMRYVKTLTSFSSKWMNPFHGNCFLIEGCFLRGRAGRQMNCKKWVI